MLDKICHHCATVFQISEREHGIALNRGQSKFYCTNACVGLSRRRSDIEKICTHCSMSFSRKRIKANDSGLYFCTTKCSNSHRASKTPPIKSCLTCGLTLSNLTKGQKAFCSPTCSSNIQHLSKKELLTSRGTYQSYRTTIQKLARNIYFKENLQPFCLVCGYTKHIEVCHIKPVASFDDSTLISEINRSDNLLGLCPTHHWEFDNGQLDSQIAGTGFAPVISKV